MIQMKGPNRFQPNTAMDPKFTDALRRAKDNGVGILAYDTVVTEDGMELRDPVKVEVSNIIN